jgi:hypothetical protein
VLGQTALFPFGPTAVWKNSSGAKIDATDASTNNGNGVISSANLSLSVTGYAGFSSPFATTQEIVDDLGRVRALHWKDGAMEPQLNAITPFKITAPTIANNCVKSLKIRIGVINWCDKGKNMANDAAGPYAQPKDAFGRAIPLVNNGLDPQINVAGAPVYLTLKNGNGDNNRADWWFGELEGSNNFVDPDLLQKRATPDKPPYWTTLTVNNSAADIAACSGTPVDVTVEPHGSDFDTFLTGPNTQPFTKGSGPF